MALRTLPTYAQINMHKREHERIGNNANAYIRARTHANAWIFMCMQAHARKDTDAPVCICIQRQAYVCLCMHMRAYARTCTHGNGCIAMHPYACVCYARSLMHARTRMHRYASASIRRGMYAYACTCLRMHGHARMETNALTCICHTRHCHARHCHCKCPMPNAQSRMPNANSQWQCSMPAPDAKCQCPMTDAQCRMPNA